jgi:thymidine phosphorylase
MVAALGGPADFITGMDRYLDRAPIVRDIVLEGDGVITAIDTRAIGMAVVTLGGGRRLPTDSIDFAVGFDRIVGLGTKVDGKTRSATIHARDENVADEAERRFRAAFTIGASAPVHPIVADHVGPSEA